MGLLKGNVINFGDDNVRIDIIVFKVFENSQDDFLNNYVELFSHFIEWMKQNDTNIRFFDFLKYLSENNDEIIFKDADFTIEENHGVIIDTTSKMVAEIDGIIQLSEAFVCIKGAEFWIADTVEFKKRYYFSF